MANPREEDFDIEISKRVQTRANIANSLNVPNRDIDHHDSVWLRLKERLSGGDSSQTNETTSPSSEVVTVEMSTALLLTRSKELLQHFRPGSEVDDYEIEELIGIGGYGAVFRANRAGDEQHYAIKILNLPEKQLRPDNDGVYDLDLAALEDLEHPGILAPHVVGSHKGYRYLVFDLFLGNEDIPLTLDDYRRMFQSTVDQETARQIFMFLLDAVGDAHKNGITHLALKPSNILLQMETGRADDGSCSVRVKMSDWGTSMFMGEDAVHQILRRARKHAGNSAQTPDAAALDETLAFMAPELLTSSVAGKQADIYSLGVILRQFITGVKGKVAVQPTSVNKELNPGWNEIIKRATHPNVTKRFKSVSEFHDALETMADLPVM